MNDKSFRDALAEMKTSRRPGVVIGIPDDFRFQLGELSESLAGLFAAGGVDRAVFVVARSADTRARFGQAPTLLALDPDGRPLGSRDGDLLEALRPAAFQQAVDELLSAFPARASLGLKTKLPYGVEWGQATHRQLFGTDYDPCPPCGMPRVGPNEAELIRYLRLME